MMAVFIGLFRALSVVPGMATIRSQTLRSIVHLSQRNSLLSLTLTQQQNSGERIALKCSHSSETNRRIPNLEKMMFMCVTLNGMTTHEHSQLIKNVSDDGKCVNGCSFLVVLMLLLLLLLNNTASDSFAQEDFISSEAKKKQHQFIYYCKYITKKGMKQCEPREQKTASHTHTLTHTY